MAKKTALEKKLNKELKKTITPKVVLVFLLFLIIGVGVGFGYQYFKPKDDYSYQLNGEKIVYVETKKDYVEELISVYKNEELLEDVSIDIEGNIEDKVGTYIIKYTIKDIKELEGVVLQRIIVIKGVTSDEKSEDSYR